MNKIYRYLVSTLAAFVISVLMVPALVYAAPAEGATIESSGTSGTVTWELYTDGTLVIRPTSGDEGTMARLNIGSVYNSPWTAYRESVKKVETQGTIHLESKVNCMFYGLKNCTEMDLSGFDTKNVTSMSDMFSGCSSLTSLDLSGFNTGNVTSMNNMFGSCSALTTLDLSGFDTGNVTNMDYMFQNCRVLTSLDLSDFNTGNVTSMSGMFDSCSALASLDLSGFDTGNVANMSRMFYNCSALTSLDLSDFETGNVTTMGSMFYNCSALTSLDLSDFETGNVTTMDSMFYDCNALTSLDLSGFNTGKVTTMAYMFYGCSALTSLDLSGFNTGNVTYLSSIFQNCSALTSLDLSGFETGNVTNMSSMFRGCSALTSLDLSGFETGNVATMAYMFFGCSSLISLDLRSFDTSKVRDMSSMFSSCNSITSLNVSSFDTSKVTSMSYMFDRCSSLASLDIKNFDTSNATNMGFMFANDPSLSAVELGERFRFKGKNITRVSSQAFLYTPPSATTTRKWIREDGTVEGKTPYELRNQYDDNAAAWAGKWIWEEKPVSFIVKFLPPEDGTYSGSMPDQKIKASEAGALNRNAFMRFDYSFDHWEGSDGKTYTDGQTIPAGTFKVGDTLTLTAVFTKDQHVLDFTDGEAQFTLKAGERALFSSLPGGTSYQIWEETPSGWQLVKQVAPAGRVPANGTAEAMFYNEYVPGTATITLRAQKTIDGHIPAEGAFEFELVDADGNVTASALNNASGVIEFEPIIFTEPGTYIYSIREKRGEDTKVNYDPHTETVIITVEDDGQGNLSAVSSAQGTLPSFTNETKPGMLQITKRAEGGNGDEVFTFEIELTNDSGMPLGNVNIVGGR